MNVAERLSFFRQLEIGPTIDIDDFEACEKAAS
jgi:hypothetical protein